MRRHIDVRDRVDRMATVIQSFGAVGEDTSKTGFGDEFLSIVGLVHVDGKVILFANDWGEAISGAPVVWIKVAEDDNAIFGPVRNAIYLFIILERAMEGRALPTEGQRGWYWASVMYSQVWVST